MALENPYCSVADVQARCRDKDAALVPTIEAGINAASRFIDDYKGRDYLYHNHSSTPLKISRFDGAILGEVLFLPYIPIITLTSVVVAGTTWLADDDYVALDSRRLCSLDGEWPTLTPPDYIVLTGTFGYVQATSAAVPTGLPEHIRAACSMIAAALADQLQKDQIGLDGQRISISDREIPKRAMLLLGNRKVMV